MYNLFSLFLNYTYWYNLTNMGKVEIKILGKIRHTEKFRVDFEKYLVSPSGANVSAALNMRDKKIKYVNESYRVINHWESLGFIENTRDNESDWRKFSWIDIVWIKIISELRKFGYSNDCIVNVKKSLKKFNGLNQDKTQFLILEFFVALVSIYRVPCFVLIFDNCEAEVVNFQLLQENILQFGLNNYVNINLNNILNEILPGEDFSPVFNDENELTDEEKELLLYVRANDYETLTIKKQNGKIEYIESTSLVPATKKIVDILKEGSYQNIDIKQRDGKIVSIKKTKRIK